MTDERLKQAGSRAFISFWLYFFAVVWLAMAGADSRSASTHWTGAALVLGGAITLTLYFRGIARAHAQLTTPKRPLWAGSGMHAGVWVMAGVACLSLVLTIPHGIASW